MFFSSSWVLLVANGGSVGQVDGASVFCSCILFLLQRLRVLEHAVFSGFDIPPVPQLVQPVIINWIESENKIRIELLMSCTWVTAIDALAPFSHWQPCWGSLFCKRPFRFLIFLTSTFHRFFTASCRGAGCGTGCWQAVPEALLCFGIWKLGLMLFFKVSLALNFYKCEPHFLKSLLLRNRKLLSF